MMLHIEIEPVWRFRKEGSPQAAIVMLGILNEIRQTGKLTSAATHANLSYRHVWNLIEQWSAFFGAALVERQRGRGTTLTPFGEKLVWAGQRLEARLGPQLQNLAQELASEIKPFLHQEPSVIRVHASHGFAVSKLREMLDRLPALGVDLRYVSNQNSLVSLAQNACDLSGVHLPRGPLREQNIRSCLEWLDPREDRVISLVTREMGLMVKRGNPLQINSLEDLVARKARFVNRDHDSGTRQVFNQLLELHGIHPSAVHETQLEFTHAAVAAFVASEMADASFGVEAAARQFGLDFIPLVTEDYFFVCHRAFLDTVPMHHLLELMKGDEFRDAVSKLPGYSPSNPGEISPVKDFFESMVENPGAPAPSRPPVKRAQPGKKIAAKTAVKTAAKTAKKKARR
ncbi:helix-turn-helix transcriptional regulator [[Pseudomonas] carboxydohydrogena]|uniref:Helix-turn-helix transcriptional regulator n=2 Tax=Afipia carboxydohydrogena TaxID=290 RepID=A0ABY8BQV7_AFICR|nr:helix-turn-helix transcriptional regulator [[Pseudomonas] carboxydohydrogena]